jgi:hypothetical protein
MCSLRVEAIRRVVLSWRRVYGSRGGGDLRCLRGGALYGAVAMTEQQACDLELAELVREELAWVGASTG